LLINCKTKDGIAYGAKGIGEICSIPTTPAVALACYNYDGEFRISLPLKNTAYSKKK
jgi:aldehyde oxidoreductase